MLFTAQVLARKSPNTSTSSLFLKTIHPMDDRVESEVPHETFRMEDKFTNDDTSASRNTTLSVACSPWLTFLRVLEDKIALESSGIAHKHV